MKPNAAAFFALAVISLPLPGSATTVADIDPGIALVPPKRSPNLMGKVGRALRYTPVDGDFVIMNGSEFFNRALYGGNTAFRVDGGDKPEFVLLQPARSGNLRLGVKTDSSVKWLNEASQIVTRYRPGELLYEIRDPAFGDQAVIVLEVLAYNDTEGMIVRTLATNLPRGAELIWAYGGANGERSGGDIGTDKLPVTQLFQLRPEYAEGNTFTLNAQGFVLNSAKGIFAGVVPTGSRQHLAASDLWDNLPALLRADTAAPTRPLVVGRVPLQNGEPLLLSLQRIEEAGSRSSGSADPMLPVFTRAQLPEEFAATRRHFDAIRNRVRIETPDPYLDAGMGALNIVSDSLWDSAAQAIMHGSIAWRAKLLGWRGPYVLDALGWHDRARRNFNTWTPRQNIDPIPAAIPTPDPKFNLARNERGLHSNGDMSGNHYDMNMVFMDALFRHLLWTGDTDFARQVWPVIERHLAWEKRLFRREYGPEKLPIYESYLTLWASDGLYYGGGGTAHASAYNIYANRMAARIAQLVGKDPAPYVEEANQIEIGLHRLLWIPEEGTFAESKDIVGQQLLHRDYGLWNFYHTVDEEAVTPREAWSMGTAMRSHLPAIPVEGPGVPNDRPYHVYSETDWMPYMWSINNVVMEESMHTALALWEGGHIEDAYALAKGAMLASQYMGITPGNVGTMQFLDVNRRESQSDFGDGAGTMSRTLIEGLFGIRPDALAGTLTVAPGFPAEWQHARLTHPDVGLNFVRTGRSDLWEISQPSDKFKTVTLRVPAAFSQVREVTVNGVKAAWRSDPEAAGRPLLEVVARGGPATSIEIQWTGEAINSDSIARATLGQRDGDFSRRTQGAFTWWAETRKAPPPVAAAAAPFDWTTPRRADKMVPVDLAATFNDQVSAIFAPGKYLTPRAQGVSLSLPSQGIGAWNGFDTMAVIDDSGLRKVAANHGNTLLLADGVGFATPGAVDGRNIAFTSQWDNYPHEITVPLSGRAKHLYLLMAGSTNHQQSRMDNGEVIVTYTDGTTSRLALRNPDTWWPIEQDYFIDDYQFPDPAPLPPRVDLRTGKIRLLDPVTFKGKGAAVPGGAATVLNLALDPSKELQSLTVRTIANEVVIGLMSATLERP
jgi:hypothetical protein